MMNVTVIGDDIVIKGFDLALDLLEKKLVKALDKVAKNALEKDILPITPMSAPDSLTSGNLRASGEVKTRKTGSSIESRITFGGSLAPYAAKVHELPELYGREIHWTTPGTGDKYLEKPIRSNKDRYINEIAELVRII